MKWSTQHPLWRQVAEDFKNPDVRFGCIAPLDPILLKEGIDLCAAANISANDVFEVWNGTIKTYDKHKSDWERSCQHQDIGV